MATASSSTLASMPYSKASRRRNAHKDEIEHEKKVPPGGWREGDRVAALFHVSAVAAERLVWRRGHCCWALHEHVARQHRQLVVRPVRRGDSRTFSRVAQLPRRRISISRRICQRRVEDAAKLLSLGGWHAGDRVVSNVDHGKIAKGDVGIIYSPCAERLDRWDERVSVDFGVDKGSAALIGIGLQSEAQWLARKEENAAKVLAAGGWRIGDRVVSIIKHKPNNVKVGDVGTVVGPSEGQHRGATRTSACASNSARRRARSTCTARRRSSPRRRRGDASELRRRRRASEGGSAFRCCVKRHHRARCGEGGGEVGACGRLPRRRSRGVAHQARWRRERRHGHRHRAVRRYQSIGS